MVWYNCKVTCVQRFSCSVMVHPLLRIRWETTCLSNMTVQAKVHDAHRQPATHGRLCLGLLHTEDEALPLSRHFTPSLPPSPLHFPPPAEFESLLRELRVGAHGRGLLLRAGVSEVHHLSLTSRKELLAMELSIGARSRICAWLDSQRNKVLLSAQRSGQVVDVLLSAIANTRTVALRV